MAEIDFFVAWELWQQMTFVLAGMIVLVFIAGLIKLWYKNRLLRKHTILDEEKRARQQEMRRSGLPLGRRADIPFGVRAIQSGIEVDGIWISRPGTPVESDSPASTLLGNASEPRGKEKAPALVGGFRAPTMAVAEVQPSPDQTPGPSPTPSLLEHNHQTEAAPSPLRSPLMGQQTTYKPRHSTQRLANITSNEMLNITTPRDGPPQIETYIPTTSFSMEQAAGPTQHRVPAGRNSSSSDEGASQWNTQSTYRYQDVPVSTPARKRSPFEDSEPSSPTMDFQERAGYLPAHEPEQRRNPFQSGESDRAPSQASYAHRHNSSYGSTESQIMPPKRSYSGETHANTASRRVNAGFEVLPAGTFTRSNSQNELEDDQSTRGQRRFSSATNKLQKKGRN